MKNSVPVEQAVAMFTGNGSGYDRAEIRAAWHELTAGAVDGKVLAEGTHESLVASSERYRQVLSLEHLEEELQGPELPAGDRGGPPA